MMKKITYWRAFH